MAMAKRQADSLSMSRAEHSSSPGRDVRGRMYEGERMPVCGPWQGGPFSRGSYGDDRLLFLGGLDREGGQVRAGGTLGQGTVQHRHWGEHYNEFYDDREFLMQDGCRQVDNWQPGWRSGGENYPCPMGTYNSHQRNISVLAWANGVRDKDVEGGQDVKHKLRYNFQAEEEVGEGSPTNSSISKSIVRNSLTGSEDDVSNAIYSSKTKVETAGSESKGLEEGELEEGEIEGEEASSVPDGRPDVPDEKPDERPIGLECKQSTQCFRDAELHGGGGAVEKAPKKLHGERKEKHVANNVKLDELESSPRRGHGRERFVEQWKDYHRSGGHAQFTDLPQKWKGSPRSNSEAHPSSRKASSTKHTDVKEERYQDGKSRSDVRDRRQQRGEGEGRRHRARSPSIDKWRDNSRSSSVEKKSRRRARSPSVDKRRDRSQSAEKKVRHRLRSPSEVEKRRDRSWSPSPDKKPRSVSTEREKKRGRSASIERKKHIMKDAKRTGDRQRPSYMQDASPQTGKHKPAESDDVKKTELAGTCIVGHGKDLLGSDEKENEEKLMMESQSMKDDDNKAERDRLVKKAAELVRSCTVRDAQRSFATVCEKLQDVLQCLFGARALLASPSEGKDLPRDIAAVAGKAFDGIRSVYTVANTEVGRQAEPEVFSRLWNLSYGCRHKLFTLKQARELEGWKRMAQVEALASRSASVARKEGAPPTVGEVSNAGKGIASNVASESDAMVANRIADQPKPGLPQEPRKTENQAAELCQERKDTESHCHQHPVALPQQLHVQSDEVAMQAAALAAAAMAYAQTSGGSAFKSPQPGYNSTANPPLYGGASGYSSQWGWGTAPPPPVVGYGPPRTPYALPAAPQPFTPPPPPKSYVPAPPSVPPPPDEDLPEHIYAPGAEPEPLPPGQPTSSSVVASGALSGNRPQASLLSRGVYGWSGGGGRGQQVEGESSEPSPPGVIADALGGGAPAPAVGLDRQGLALGESEWENVTPLHEMEESGWENVTPPGVDRGEGLPGADESIGDQWGSHFSRYVARGNNPGNEFPSPTLDKRGVEQDGKGLGAKVESLNLLHGAEVGARGMSGSMNHGTDAVGGTAGHMFESEQHHKVTGLKGEKVNFKVAGGKMALAGRVAGLGKKRDGSVAGFEPEEGSVKRPRFDCLDGRNGTEGRRMLYDSDDDLPEADLTNVHKRGRLMGGLSAVGGSRGANGSAGGADLKDLGSFENGVASTEERKRGVPDGACGPAWLNGSHPAASSGGVPCLDVDLPEWDPATDTGRLEAVPAGSCAGADLARWSTGDNNGGDSERPGLPEQQEAALARTTSGRMGRVSSSDVRKVKGGVSCLAGREAEGAEMNGEEVSRGVGGGGVGGSSQQGHRGGAGAGTRAMEGLAPSERGSILGSRAGGHERVLERAVRLAEGEKVTSKAELERRLQEQERMLKARKLCLVLDLDHTLLNSAKFSEVEQKWDAHLKVVEENEKLKAGPGGRRQLYCFPSMNMWTKLRPGIWRFLAKASQLYELHVYTMGNRAYATEIARLLDPSGELFAGRVISKGDIDTDGSDSPAERTPKFKDLDGVLGNDSTVIILDDSSRVWPNHSRNLIEVERYIYFPSSMKQFQLEGKSLLERYEDEREGEGMLAVALNLVEGIHREFFKCPENLESKDVRSILAIEKSKVLSGVTILFSRVFPIETARPETNRFWRLAESLGGRCTTSMDNSVTHVVAGALGTDKVMWARANGKHVVAPTWLEACSFFYRRAEERAFPAHN